MSLTQINKAGLDELALDHVFTIGASGSSAYTFQGEGLNGTVNNPTLYLTRGKTYRFENGSGGHPIRIQSTSGASGTAYNTGVTNNAGSGTVIVEVQHDAPDVLYYQCTSHAAMNGILYITGALADGGVTSAKLANDAVIQSKIAAGAVNTTELADNAVDSSKLASNSVTATQIASNAVTSNKIDSGAITNTHIGTGAINADRLTDATVTLAKLEHGTSSNDGKFLRANNGADPTFETVSAGPTIANQGDNRVITATGTTDALNAESNVTIDSSARMTISSTAHGDALTISSGGTTYGGSLHLTGTGSPNQDYVIAVGGGDNAYVTGRGLLIRDITNSANRIGILTDGNLQIHDGNLKLASGHGIDFSATGNGGATMQNELLDDYEEGTFTPSLRGNNNNSSPAITGNGKYTKVGRLVHVWISFQNKNQTYLPSGEYIQIHGLPYTIGGGTQVAHHGMNYKIGFSTNYQYYWYLPSGGTIIWGYYNVNAAAYQAWGTDQWKSAGPIYHENSFTYMIN